MGLDITSGLVATGGPVSTVFSSQSDTKKADVALYSLGISGIIQIVNTAINTSDYDHCHECNQLGTQLIDDINSSFSDFLISACPDEVALNDLHDKFKAYWSKLTDAKCIKE